MTDIYVLGVNLSHDSSSALLKNGQLVCAIAEERLDRIKHSNVGISPEGTVHNLLPWRSISYCLQTAGIRPDDLELVVVSSCVVVSVHDYRTRNLTKEEVMAQLPDGFNPDRVVVLSHHIGHAASAFFPSGFSEAVVLVADGGGSLVFNEEDSGYPEGWYEERTTIYTGCEKELEIIDQYFDGCPTNGFLASDEPCSLGDLYQSATEFIGFRAGNEGKTMGLAPYGSDRLFKAFKDAVGLAGEKMVISKDFQFNKRHTTEDYYKRAFGKSHKPGEDLRDLDRDISAGVQFALEEILVELAQKAYDKTKIENLCLAGGIALNSVANKLILDRTPFRNIFVQPASGDDGCALGNALIGWVNILDKPNNFTMGHAYTGRSYTPSEIELALEKYGGWIRVSQKGDILGDVCRLLTQKKIIGWVQGGSEFGPRALGHRSILCDPRHPQMKDILNRRVKHREAFRPYAPSVLIEHASEYFDLDCASPFMLLIAKIKKPEQIPAVNHVDGTGRVQTVTREDNGIYYDLIEKFHELTGVPVLLDTSFNDNEEPIVETPEDTLRCFSKTNIDYLVIGDYLISKRKWKCMLLRIWPNSLKHIAKRKIRKTLVAWPLLAKLIKPLRRRIGPGKVVQVRVPG